MCRSYVLEIENKHKTFPLRFTSSQTVVTEPQISTAPLVPESEDEKRNIIDAFNNFRIGYFKGVAITGNTSYIKASLQKSLFIVQKIESNCVIVLNKDFSS